MTTIVDQPTRKRALDPKQSYIVQAPAGSGKTELLTQRYLMLLAHAEKAPEEIVAITFTRKAAAEMRTRILDALAFAKTKRPDQSDYRFTTWDLANKVNAKDKSLSWQLTHNPNRLRILTIDALATFLCRQTPMLTHFGMQPQICEQATPFYEQAANQLILHLSQESAWQPALTQLLLHLDNQVNKLEELFANLLEHRDQWLPHIMQTYHHDPARLRETLEAGLQRIVLEKMALAKKHFPEATKQTMILLAQHAGHYFESNTPDHPIAACTQWHPDHTPHLNDFQAWYGLAQLLLTKTGEWRKTVTIRMGFDSKDPNKQAMITLLATLQSEEGFKNALVALLRCPPDIYTDTQWETLTTLTQLLPLLVAQLHLVFQEKGQIDFVALNLGALKALGTEESPTDLALYLDYQIRHLLIDEFQDTSVVHMEMIEKITTGWEPGDGRTLFLVGDPMQSIYRFRNAEVGLFLRTQQQGIGHINLTPLTLTMNFRSQKGMVDWFNDTFNTIFPSDADIATGRVPYTLAIAALPLKNSNCVQTHFFATQTVNAQAQQIVDIIKKIRAENSSESIAILSRSRNQLAPIIMALHEAQVTFQAVDIEPLAHRPEIQDLLSLLRALQHRADRIAWLSILRAPFCGCTLSDLLAVASFDEKHTIWEAILQAENITKLSETGLQRIQRLRKTLQDAFAYQQDHTLAEWIEGIWLQLGGPETLNNNHEINQVQLFFNLIDKIYQNNTIFNISAFTDALLQLYAEPNHEKASTLQIMTIHKSKGLEFDHVLIPDLQRATPPDSEKLFRWLERPSALGTNDLILAPIKPASDQMDPIYHYLKQVEREKLDHEMTRLFYVAATRAKKALHLFATIQPNDKKPMEAKSPTKGSFLGKLWPLLKTQADAFCAQSRLTDSAFKPDIQHQITTLKRLKSDWTNPFLPNQHSLETQQTQRLVSIPLTLDTQQARLTGTMIHRIFQRIIKKEVQLSNDQMQWPYQQWRSELIALGVAFDELEAACKLVQLAISNTLADPRGQWILSSHHKESKTEWALTTTTPDGPKQFIIDRAFVDTTDNTRWIIDYKTSQKNSDESISSFLDGQKSLYQMQLVNYANLVKTVDDRPIKLGLYFPLEKAWIAWEA